MDEEATDKSIVENLLKKSQTLKNEVPKEAELSDEDELDKYMAGIEVNFFFFFNIYIYFFLFFFIFFNFIKKKKII